jgi:hypothetical protein
VLDGLKLTGISNNNKYNFERFEFFSNLGSLVVTTASATQGKGWSVQGVVKPAWLPILKHDLSFEGAILISDGQLSQLKLAGFSHGVSVELKEQDLHVQANNLNLGEYFKLELPITGLSGEMV